MQFLHKSEVFQNSHKKLPIVWASFARYSVAKNFQKSPNLVTLVVIDDKQSVMRSATGQIFPSNIY